MHALPPEALELIAAHLPQNAMLNLSATCVGVRAALANARLGRSAAHSIDEEGPELVAPIFVDDRPHSALVPNTRVVDARFGLGGMLLGYMTDEGKCVGNVEGGLKESRGIGARVVFDE